MMRHSNSNRLNVILGRCIVISLVENQKPTHDFPIPLSTKFSLIGHRLAVNSMSIKMWLFPIWSTIGGLLGYCWWGSNVVSIEISTPHTWPNWSYKEWSLLPESARCCGIILKYERESRKNKYWMTSKIRNGKIRKMVKCSSINQWS